MPVEAGGQVTVHREDEVAHTDVAPGLDAQGVEDAGPDVRIGGDGRIEPVAVVEAVQEMGALEILCAEGRSCKKDRKGE